MAIQLALQNTLMQFPGMTVDRLHYQNRFWTIKLVKGVAELEFEIDETIRSACVLERKNMGYNSMSRVMNAFIQEMERLEEDEDPINPPRD